MNYSELVTAITDYVQEGDTTFTAHIDDFIRQAEERIYRAVMIPELRKTDTTAMVASTATAVKPADYLATFEFAVVDGSGNHSFLLPKEVSFIREAYPSPSTTGLPVYYAETSSSAFLLGPTPDANYATELHYFYDPESIVTAATTWLGDNAETVLLYACVSEAYRFLKGDADLMATYETRYSEAKDDAIKIGIMNKRDDYRS